MKYKLPLIAVLFAGLASPAYAQTYVTGISTSGVQTQTLQFYADQCGQTGHPLANNGTSDDAAALRACMATLMPLGTSATMNLDGSKPYLIASHSTLDSQWGTNSCGLIVRSQQTLNLNGATITQSSSEGSAFGQTICAGSNNQNTPFGSGTEGTDNTSYLPIADTAGGATSVTVSNARCPASGSVTGGTTFSCCGSSGSGTCVSAGDPTVGYVHAGDWLYVDCGANPSDADVYIGWGQAAANQNLTTGVIPLAYPLVKPYTHAECPAGLTPRIFDYDTGNLQYGTPLAHDTYIEGPGSIQLAPGSASQGLLFFDGCVHCGADNITALATGGATAQFNFGNNMHLSHFNDDKFQTDGGGGDTFFNVSEFTGSLNTADHDTITLTGVGATGTEYERALGDSEGDESNINSNDTVTVLAGGSANVDSLCAYEYQTWNDSYVNLTCNSQYAGFQDGPVGFPNQSGPTTIKDSYFYTVQNNGLNINSDDDQIIGNTIIANGALPIYLQAQAQILHNHIVATASPGGNGLILLSSGVTGNTPYYSQINGNTFDCQGVGCSVGININDPGTSITQPLTITGNTFQDITTNLQWPGSATANLPNACVNGNGHGVATTC